MNKLDNRKEIIKGIISELRHQDTDTLHEVYARLRRR